VKAPYTVALTQLDDGSILAQIGCKTLSYRPSDPILADLTAYFNDPQATIKRFSEAFGWAIEQTGAPMPSTGLGYSRNLVEPQCTGPGLSDENAAYSKRDRP